MPVPAAERAYTDLGTNRLTVAMVPFANATGDPGLDHWRFAASYVLGTSLAEAKGLRLLPASSLKYGLAQLHRKSGDLLNREEATRLGEIIEARRVLWGTCGRDGRKWQVTFTLLNVAEGTVSKQLTASSSDWFDVRDELTKQVLQELGVKTTSAERRKMKARWTKSAVTLENLSRARAALDDKRPASEWEQYAALALKADPQCAEALTGLAAAKGTRGQTDDALALVRRAIQLKPDLAVAHGVLGSVLMLDQRVEDAQEPLTQATLLDPDSATAFSRLAEHYMLNKSPAWAVDLFKEAIHLAPFQASVHANLGRAYLFLGKREAGLAELKEAERLTFEPDLNNEEYLAWGYMQLHDAPAAIEHYEKVMPLARRVGLSPERLKMFERDLEQLKASLNPVCVTSPQPRDYSEASLAEACREKLGVEEIAFMVKPLSATPEMNQCAREITLGVTNGVQKAKLLFEALAVHLDVGEKQLRTAPEVFAAWKGGDAAFTCQEYALVYTMMARAVGLRAYMCDVVEACDGEAVSHACAAVFDGEKVLLIDPSYQWFGVPHKKFKVMDDLAATAEYLCQLDDIRLRRVAAKLQPDSAYAVFKLATGCTAEQCWTEARELLPTVERLDGNGAMTYALKARLALHGEDFEQAAEFAEKSLEKGWPVHDCAMHLILGMARHQQGRLAEARDAFRNVLRRSPDEKSARVASRSIARINERLGAD